MDDGSDGIIFELHSVLGVLEAITVNELGMVISRLDKTSDELLGVDTELGGTMDEMLGDSVDAVLDSVAHTEFGNALVMEETSEQKRWLALN